MSSAGVGTDTATEIAEVGTVDMKLEVVTLPVSDVDRAKAFYQSLGWRLDADIVVGENFRVVQVTPPHSACSVAFGKGVTTAEPGSAQRLILAVDDIDAAREDLVRRGADVSGVFHLDGGPVPGTRSGGTLLPDLRVVQRSRRQRLAAPGDHDAAPRPGMGGLTMDVAALAELLHETAEHHGSFEAVAPPHDWWDWYAAYMDARERGSTPDEASAAAGRYMADVKHVVPAASPAT